MSMLIHFLDIPIVTDANRNHSDDPAESQAVQNMLQLGKSSPI